MAVFGGGFAAFIAIAVMAVNMLAAKPSTQKRPAAQQTSVAASSTSRATAAPSASTQPEGSVGLDIVSIQLESAQSALREAKKETLALEKKLAKALANRDEVVTKQTVALQEQIQALGKRIRALEEDRMLNSGIAIIGPDVSTQERADEPKPTNAAYVPPKGFLVRAELGNRVWLSDGHREFSVLKTEAPPKFPAPTPRTTTRAAQDPVISTAAGQ